MLRKRWPWLALVGVVVTGAWVVFPGGRGGELPNPIESRIELVASDIYDAAQWVKKIPYDLAVPLIARSKIRSYLDELDLPPDVHGRVRKRIDSAGFVDELIPFALALRDVYLESEEYRPESFDSWLRKNFSPSDGIAGFENSMFSWNGDDEDESGGPVAAFDDDLVARLVAMYDALYLQEVGAAADLPDQLACARRVTDVQRAPAARRVQPIVRDLLEDVLSRMQSEGEMSDALRAILADENRLEAVSISLVHFLDDLVCRHYRVFATGVIREQQLGAWMMGELENPGGGALWAYLTDAQSRRYAVLTVVDGLQGHLVESLSSGEAEDRFLGRVADEYEGAATYAPETQASKAAPTQRTEFLTHIAAKGYSHSSYLRYFRRIYDSSRGVARFGIATTPTISVRNLPVAKTGAPVAGPGGTSIPNFHFVDRDVRRDGVLTGRAYYFYGNDALQLDELVRAGGMRTLFDRMPTLGSFSCGAQYDDGAHYRVDAFLSLALGEKIRDFGELRCVAELRRRAENEVALRRARSELLAKRAVLVEELRWYQVLERMGQNDERQLAEKLIDRIAALEQESMPQLFLYYNPWPDHFAHFAGPFADAILAPSGELNRLDYWLGLIGATYRSAGVEDQTLFTMVGDHGLAPVFHLLNPEEEVLDAIRARGIDLRVIKISSDEGEGPKLTNPLEPPSMRNYDAIVASTAGGNYMLDLFADPGQGWVQQPLLEQLERLEVLDGSGPLDIVSELYRGLSESLDYMVARVEPCSPQGGVIAVIGPHRGSRVTATIERRGDRIRYQSPGGDLLGVSELSPYDEFEPAEVARHAVLAKRCLAAAEQEDPDSWCSEGEWRLLTSYTARPDSVGQLAHLYDVDRAGTINLFPRFGVGYNSVVPGRHAGESFHEKDAFVGVWGAPVRRAARPQVEVIGVAAATVYAHLSGEPVRAGTDGWGYSSLPLDR